LQFQYGDQQKVDIDFTNLTFTEYYDAHNDPWMTKNLAKTAPAADLANLKAALHKWYACAGDECP
jgi:hypothetical protein